MDKAIGAARDLVGRAKQKAAAIEETAVAALAAVEAREKQVEQDAIIISAARAMSGKPPIEQVETIAERGRKRRQRPDDIR